MKIKVCGVTRLNQLVQLDSMNIDYVGLIFYKNSPRYVKGRLSPADLKNTYFRIRKAGVFVNAGRDEILDTAAEYSLDLIQLHGNEPPSLCRELSYRFPVIKAFPIVHSGMQNIQATISPYKYSCTCFLFDTSVNGRFGGSGKKFNWDLLKQIQIGKPFFLSGGLNAHDVEQLKMYSHPDLTGIDINSGFETEPGVKNMELVKKFASSIKNVL